VELEDVSVTFIPGKDRMTASAAALAAITACFASRLGPRSRHGAPSTPTAVGLPYEARPGGYWLLLGPDVEHRRTE
jgi:hypothetical protein